MYSPFKGYPTEPAVVKTVQQEYFYSKCTVFTVRVDGDGWQKVTTAIFLESPGFLEMTPLDTKLYRYIITDIITQNKGLEIYISSKL